MSECKSWWFFGYARTRFSWILDFKYETMNNNVSYISRNEWLGVSWEFETSSWNVTFNLLMSFILKSLIMLVYVVKPCWSIDRSHYPHVFLPTKLTIVSKTKVLMLKGVVFTKFTSQTKLFPFVGGHQMTILLVLMYVIFQFQIFISIFNCKYCRSWFFFWILLRSIANVKGDN